LIRRDAIRMKILKAVSLKAVSLKAEPTGRFSAYLPTMVSSCSTSPP